MRMLLQCSVHEHGSSLSNIAHGFPSRVGLWRLAAAEVSGKARRVGPS